MADFERYLQACLADVCDSVVKEAMQYSLMAGGKRIRPKLLFALLQGYGKKAELGFQAASAIEMVHTYSLIHDDLPAMDNDTLRRGKPTCHVQYGEDIAILAGDALLTQAFYQLTQACEDPTRVMQMVGLLAQYSGANGMVLGQVKDLEGDQKKDMTIPDVEDIHRYKTGKLLTLPLLFAAILAQQEKDLTLWERVGEYIGLSFQIQDDILDETSSEAVLGKNIHSDEKNGKQTYVSLLGIEKARRMAKDYYALAWEYTQKSGIDTTSLQPLFTMLAKRIQ